MAFMDVAEQFGNYAITGMLTLFIGFIIAKFAGRIVKRILKEAEINRVLATAGMKLDEIFGRIVEYTIYAITVLIILQQRGWTLLVVGILGLFFGALILFSLALAIKQFIPNAITGLFIRRKLKPFLNKRVRIGMVSGKLVHIGISESIVHDKEDHYIPHIYTSKEFDV